MAAIAWSLCESAMNSIVGDVALVMTPTRRAASALLAASAESADLSFCLLGGGGRKTTRC
jgi:hypothetical protein